MMLAAPGATPLATPVALAVASAVAAEDHVMVRLVRIAPAESNGVARNAVVLPTDTVAVGGVTVTDATGGSVTTISAVSLFDSLVAMMLAEPGATPVATPVALTVATAGAAEDHVMVRLVRIAPAESNGVAMNAVVLPTNTVAVGGVTVTDATGGSVTTISAVSLFDSLVAMMLAEPGATPVATPVALTVATAGAAEDHVMMRLMRIVPAESNGVAENALVLPTDTVAVGGVTVTD